MPSAGSRAIDRTALLGAFLRLHMATLTDERLAGLPLAEQTELNSSMDTLGDIARTYGLSRPAARIYQSALVIDERRVRHRGDLEGVCPRGDICSGLDERQFGQLRSADEVVGTGGERREAAE